MSRGATAAAIVCVTLLLAQTEQAYLPNGWRVSVRAPETQRYQGLPLGTALSPNGRYLAVLSCGFNPPFVSVQDAASGKPISGLPVAAAANEVLSNPAADAWLGVTFSAKGDRLYVGGGAEAAVFEYSFDGTKLLPTRAFPVVEPAKRGTRDFVGDIAFSPDGRLLYAAELYQNSVAVINPQSGRVIDRFKTGRRPYRVLFHPDGKSFFVSAWADGMVLRHETDNGNLAGKFLLAPHPTDMLWVPGRPKPPLEGEDSPYVARIFVTISNTNSLRVLGVTEAGDIRPSESVNLALSPLQPAGMTPSALAYDAAHGRLYVACSDENAVAVLDVSETRSRVLGYVPTGPYPTAVRTLADGRLMVFTADGPWSVLETLNDEELVAHTKTVRENSPYRDSKLEDAGTEEGNPVPSWPGDPTPIRHVVYVLINQGWTYDQVFSDLLSGKGERGRLRFGEAVTPNLHRLARESVLLDNFLVNGETLADGYNWSVAAIAPDYVRKLWPGSAAGRRRWNNFEESEPAAIPPAGYLWTNARTAGISLATYSTNRPSAEQVAAFLGDLAGFEKSGEMPRLVFVRLTSPGAAENDRAIGALAGGLAKSRFWPQMAIFMAVAHTGRGSDHVDSHRAPALVLSPYVKRRTVESSRYNTTSVLRTIELIVGLQPMTQFDAAALPLAACFQAKPDLTPPGGAVR